MDIRTSNYHVRQQCAMVFAVYHRVCSRLYLLPQSKLPKLYRNLIKNNYLNISIQNVLQTLIFIRKLPRSTAVCNAVFPVRAFTAFTFAPRSIKSCVTFSLPKKMIYMLFEVE